MFKLCALIWIVAFLAESYGWMRRADKSVDYFGPRYYKPSIRRRQFDKPILRMKHEHAGIKSKNALRIKGGEITDTRNYPYMAAIVINGRLWCAGAIVDVNWVLTAAHCLNYVLHVSPLKNLSKYVKVRVGSARPHEGGMVVDVAGTVRHPKFEEEPVPHADVALLKLNENLPLGTFINIIKIYEGTEQPFAQSFVAVSGWGATKGTGTAFKEQAPELMTARLKVRTKRYCMDAYQLVNGLQITPDFFCASYRNGSRDACLFDAGAPAIQENKLMGVMSFGPEHCGQEYQPAVFVKAFYIRDFVKSTISAYKTDQEYIAALQEAYTETEANQLIPEPKDESKQANAQVGEEVINNSLQK